MSEFKLKWYIMTILSIVLLHVWLLLVIPISFIQGMFVGAFENVMDYIDEYKSLVSATQSKKLKYRILELQEQLKEKGDE